MELFIKRGCNLLVVLVAVSLLFITAYYFFFPKGKPEPRIRVVKIDGETLVNVRLPKTDGIRSNRN